METPHTIRREDHMFSSHDNKARSELLFGLTAVVVLAFSANLYAQSPLTVQPSTGRVGVDNG